jgi:hypothetical protein
MKKRAALLAMAAMLALTPVAAFASSDNTVSKVISVKDDAELIKDPPLLKIENDGNDWDTSGETIVLKFDNAELLSDVDVAYTVTTDVYKTEKTKEVSFEELLTWKVKDKNGNTITATDMENLIETKYDMAAGSIDVVDSSEYKKIEFTGKNITNAEVVEIDKNGDKKLEIKVKNVGDEGQVEIPMLVELQGDGPAKVKVDSKSRHLTQEEVTFANGGSGDTLITIDDTNNFSNTTVLETIEIEEATEGALPYDEVEYIELELTKDFTFTELSKDEVEELQGKGSYDSNTKYYGQLSGDFLKKYASKKVMITDKNSLLDDESLKIYFDGKEADDDSKGKVKGFVELKAFDGGIGSMDFNGFTAKATKDADEGTVKVKVSSNVDEIETTSLEIGKYSEWAMIVKADGDPKEIYNAQYEEVTSSGARYDSKVFTDDESHELQTLIIEEDVNNTWDDEKAVVVELPDWVKIIDVDIDGDCKDDLKDVAIDGNEFEFTVSKEYGDDDKQIELTFYTSVEAGKTGDIEAKVSGKALDNEEFEVVLGKALAPVEIKVEETKLKAGVREQKIGDITIAETKEGMIKDGEIILELDDDDMEWEDRNIKVEVVKGDLEIEDDVDVEDNILTITVEKESDEPSVIKVSGLEVELDRDIAEGGIDIEFKGNSLIRNGYIKSDAENAPSKSELLDHHAIFTKDEYSKVEIGNVITPADDNVQGVAEAKFVIGQAEFMMGENVVVADVAPYIKDGRTMLSLSFVAKALGVESNNIMWDGETRSVTIFKGDRIAQVQIGSNKMMVNGTPIIMDTIAEIKEGRTMLPVSFVAKALGAEVAWDGATKTVTIK